MGVSLYNLYEQCYSELQGKGEPQEIIRAVKNAYAHVAKLSFFEGRQIDSAPLDGGFFYTYKGEEILKDEEGYYIKTPSTYLLLPHEFGVKSVYFSDTPQCQFWRVPNYSMWIGIKAQALGNHQLFSPDEDKFRFPTMTAANLVVASGARTITVKLAIAMDDLDVDAPRNIAPNLVQQIVDIVVSKYSNEPPKVPDKIS